MCSAGMTVAAGTDSSVLRFDPLAWEHRYGYALRFDGACQQLVYEQPLNVQGTEHQGGLFIHNSCMIFAEPLPVQKQTQMVSY